MAIGIVNDNEFTAELLAASTIHKSIEKGRGNTPEVPQVIREIIAEEAIAGTPARVISHDFGVSESSISAYKHSATSTASYDKPQDSLQKNNDRIRLQISASARERLLNALSHITPDKLANAKVRDLASVAKDMSAIVANTEPQVSNTNSNVQFIFHVPKSKQEKDFEFIDVVQ